MLTIHDVREALRSLEEQANTSDTKYQRIWRTLIVNTGGTLTVSCALCNEAYGTCRCPENGERSGFKGWRYFVAKQQQSVPQVNNWRIAMTSLDQLKPGHIVTEYPAFRALTMRVVSLLQLPVDTVTDWLTVTHFNRAFSLETATTGRSGHAKPGLWRALIRFTSGCLEVRCTSCLKSYNKQECRCSENGALADGKWVYFVDRPTQPMARMQHWSISRESLKKLTVDNIQSESLDIRDRAMRVVSQMLAATSGTKG